MKERTNGITKRILALLLSCVLTAGLVGTSFAVTDAVNSDETDDNYIAESEEESREAVQKAAKEEKIQEFEEEFGEDPENITIDVRCVADSEDETKDNNISALNTGPSTEMYNNLCYSILDNVLYIGGMDVINGADYGMPTHDHNGNFILETFDDQSVGVKAWNKYADSITKVVICENIYPLSTAKWFYGLEKLQSVENFDKIHMEYCTSMQSMFFDTPWLISLAGSGASEWDTSNVTNMGWMFFNSGIGSYSFLENWDTSSLEDMDETFGSWDGIANGTESMPFTSIDLRSWDLRNVTDFELSIGSATIKLPTYTRGFHAIEKLELQCGNESIDTTGWTTENLTNTEYMFSWCENLKSISLKNFDLSNVTHMNATFCCCDNLEIITLPTESSRSFYTDKNDESYMLEIFYLCEKLTTIYYLDKINFGSTAAYMFDLCGFETLDLSSCDLSSVKNATGMLFFSRNLKTVKFPSGSRALNSATSLNGLFWGCSSLETLDLSNVAIYSNTDVTDMFGNSVNNFSQITFGSTTQKTPTLPTPSSDYISGADGYWYDASGNKYAPDSIPTGAGTYYAVNPNPTGGDSSIKDGTSSGSSSSGSSSSGSSSSGSSSSGSSSSGSSSSGSSSSGTTTHTHTWSETITVHPTCATDGFQSYVCSECGETKTETLPATGEHVWNSGKTTTSATCTGAGVKTYTCTICGTTKTEAISATGHTKVTDSAVAPTCSSAGLTEGSHCSVCGAIIDAQQVIPATGHTYGTPNFEWAVSGSSDVTTGAVAVDDAGILRTELVKKAHDQIGVKYVSGGKSPSEGFDCSGLTRYVYLEVTGIELPGNVADNDGTGQYVGQWYYGDVIPKGTDYNKFVASLEPGDLIFMKDPYVNSDLPGHVGIYAGMGADGNAKIIDASSEASNGSCVLEENLAGRWSNITGARRIIVDKNSVTAYASSVNNSTENVMYVVCQDCGEIMYIDNYSMDIVSETKPTCTEPGIATYNVVGYDDDGNKYECTTEAEEPALGHDWNFVSAVCDDTNGNGFYDDVTAEFKCDVCDEEVYTSTEDGSLFVEIGEIEPAGCTEDGKIVYDLTALTEADVYEEISELLPATGHNYVKSDVQWVADENEQECEIEISCTGCGDDKVLDCDVEQSASVASTCATNGYIIYTATVEYDGDEFTDSMTITLDKTDHQWNYDRAAIVYNFEEGYADITVPCDNCNETLFFEHVPIQYDYTYGTWNEEEQKYEFESLRAGVVIQDENGQNWYYWEDDPYTSGIESEHDWVLVENIGNEPDCEHDGYRMYVCSNDGCGATKTVSTDALGHNWNMDGNTVTSTAKWNSDHSVCTMTFTCLRCGSTKTVDSSTVTQSTDANGNTTYTATVSFNGGTFKAIYTDTDTEVKPQTSSSDSSNGSSESVLLGSGTVSDANSTTKAQTDGEETRTTNEQQLTEAGLTDSGTNTGATSANTTGHTVTETVTTTQTASTGDTTSETGNVRTGDNLLGIFMCAGAGAIAVGSVAVVTVQRRKNKAED